jgi:hypothetical protein
MWLALLNALVQLALMALRQVERKQALDQARLEAVAELLRKSDALIRDVDSIVESVSHSPGDVLRDPANRDQPGSGDGDPKGGV